MKIKIFNIILLFVLTFQVCLSQPGNQELTEKYYLTELRGNISLDIEITDLKSNKGMINVLISDESKNEIGKIILFQSNIPHYTTVHKSEKERITIAFDLMMYKNTNSVSLL